MLLCMPLVSLMLDLLNEFARKPENMLSMTLLPAKVTDIVANS